MCVHHLWSDVVWCPTEGGRLRVVLHVLLTHAEVCYLYMTVRVQQHIIQLQIPTEEDVRKTNKYRKQVSVGPLVYCSTSVSVLFLAST